MVAATLPVPAPTESRDQRRQRLLAQLQAQAAPLLEQLADTLVDAPERELFRSVEVRVRDLGQQLAAAAQQTGLDDRKKGGTQVPAWSARSASTMPVLSSIAAIKSTRSMAK